MKTNDGGPAFPVTLFEGQTLGDGTANGMTLRDWFAGQALAGMRLDIDNPRVIYAPAAAYQYADGMLAARETKKED